MTFSHYSAEENNTRSKLAIFVNRPFCSTNSGYPDQMQHCVASHLGLCCLPISSHKKDSRRIGNKQI